MTGYYAYFIINILGNVAKRYVTGNKHGLRLLENSNTTSSNNT